LPFYGPYQTSKWAFEALAENYRIELSTFGIENCVVEPGGYPTKFSENLLDPVTTVGKYHTEISQNFPNIR
jgi:NAD(P)-dependent dehydrogenase (short-subunit alcohol dehydrogenase family)